MASNIDHSTWNVIYPAYLDKDSTTTQGRKVNLAIAVSKPTLDEIKSVLEHLNVPHIVEPRKRYPRNWLVPGRVRVFLGNSSSDPSESNATSNKSNNSNTAFDSTSGTDIASKRRTKKQLLNEIATLISQLKTRQTSTGTAKSGTDKGSISNNTGKKKPSKKKR